MADAQTEAAITGCLLAGGEGRRMGGQDKGLLLYKGQPLGSWVLRSLSPQVSGLMISANRNHEAYCKLLQAQAPAKAQGVWPDDPDLPPRSGPLAGILTALRHCPGEWLLVAPCDTPHLPADLASRLMAEAVANKRDIVVASTFEADHTPHLHWVCALIHKRVCPQTAALFVTGERKVGNWVRALNWGSVSFANTNAFINVNTPETLHGRA